MWLILKSCFTGEETLALLGRAHPGSPTDRWDLKLPLLLPRPVSPLGSEHSQHPVSSQRPSEEQGRRVRLKMEEAALLTVKMEEGAMSQGYGTSRNWKRPEMVLPGA